MTESEATAGGGQPKNFVKPCLLLLLAERPAHGYELLDRLRDLIPAAGYDRGGVYRVLRQLETEGAVSSTWEPSQQGPDRRHYELTTGGWQWLGDWADTLRRQRLTVDGFLQRHAAVAADGEVEVRGRRRRLGRHDEQPAVPHATRRQGERG